MTNYCWLLIFQCFGFVADCSESGSSPSHASEVAAPPKVALLGLFPEVADGDILATQILTQTYVTAVAISDLANRSYPDGSSLSKAEWKFFATRGPAAASKFPGRVETDVSIIQTIRIFHDTGFIAIIGLDNLCYEEARIAAVTNRLLITPACTDSRVMSMPQDFPTFIRLSPTNRDFGDALMAFLASRGYDAVAFIRARDTGIRTLQGSLENSLLTSLRQAAIDVMEILYEPNEASAFQRIGTTFLKTRVFILSGSPNKAGVLLTTMDRLGLMQTGEFVILSLFGIVMDDLLLTSNEEAVEFLSGWAYPVNSRTLQCGRNLLMLGRTFASPEIKAKRQQVEADAYALRVLLKPGDGSTTLVDPPARWMCPPLCFTNNKLRPISPGPTFPIPTINMAYYDAIRILADVYAEAYSLGIDIRNGSSSAELWRNRTLESGRFRGGNSFTERSEPTGVTVTQEQDDPRFYDFSDFQLGRYAFALRRSSMDNFEKVWLLLAHQREPIQLNLSSSKADTTKQLVLALLICTSITVSAAVVYFRHWTYERELEQQLWRINIDDLRLYEDATGHSSAVNRVSASPMLAAPHASYRSGGSFRADSKLEYNMTRPTAGSIPAARQHMKAEYKQQPVYLKRINKQTLKLTLNARKELRLIRHVRHDHLCTILGIAVDAANTFVVMDYCSRGCLRDLLEDQELKLEAMFTSGIVSDIVKGMIYLHSEVGWHGNLKATNTLITCRWLTKLSGYGLREFRKDESDPPGISNDEKCRGLLWCSPEVLRSTSSTHVFLQKADAYSFGIILHEIFGRRGTFGGNITDPAATLERIKSPGPSGDVFRPPLELVTTAPVFVINLMTACWSEDPKMRPTFKEIERKLKPLRLGMRANIFDDVLALMEKHATNLEEVVKERTIQLNVERQKSEKLLLMLLPATVAEQLKLGKPVEAEVYDEASIYFSDVVGFTALCSNSTALEVVILLNDLYTCFDTILGMYDVYKVETIGDAYMVASGLPVRNGDNHAGEIASVSLRLLEAVKNFKIRHRPSDSLKLRIGLHSGSCVAGVVGLVMPRYCLFGDTVHMAQRIESTGEALKIQCSAPFNSLLEAIGGYRTVLREQPEEIKTKLKLPTFWLIDEDSQFRSDRIEKAAVNFPSL